MMRGIKHKPDTTELGIIDRISKGELSRYDKEIEQARKSLSALAENASRSRKFGIIGRLIWGKADVESQRLNDLVSGLEYSRKYLIERTMDMTAFHREREKLGYPPRKDSPSNKAPSPPPSLRALASASGPSM
jgi:hypothetical protein